jgi:hypothetical protein
MLDAAAPGAEAPAGAVTPTFRALENWGSSVGRQPLAAAQPTGHPSCSDGGASASAVPAPLGASDPVPSIGRRPLRTLIPRPPLPAPLPCDGSAGNSWWMHPDFSWLALQQGTPAQVAIAYQHAVEQHKAQAQWASAQAGVALSQHGLARLASGPHDQQAALVQPARGEEADPVLGSHHSQVGWAPALRRKRSAERRRPRAPLMMLKGVQKPLYIRTAPRGSAGGGPTGALATDGPSAPTTACKETQWIPVPPGWGEQLQLPKWETDVGNVLSHELRRLS